MHRIIFLLIALLSFQISAQDDLFTPIKVKDISEYSLDPTKYQFVSVDYMMPNCWGDSYPSKIYGWKDTETNRIHLSNEVFYLEESECIKVVDTSFEGYVRRFYLKNDSEEKEDPFAQMDRFARGTIVTHPLMIEHWCNELGMKGLGTQVKQYWKKNAREKDEKEALKLWLSGQHWLSFSGMVHHYMQRKDLIAERYANEINEVYPGTKSTPQAEAIIEELARRKKKGNFNVESDSIPEGYHNWSWDKKADFLIERLDEIDQRQWGQPGGVSLGWDWRIQHLVAIGDSAVPKLINVIEMDKRFTRSVHFWRDFSQSRTVLSVKEAALSAIMSIWQDPLFEPASTGDNFTARGEAAAKELAKQLWEQLGTYAGKTLDERKIEVLRDRDKEPRERIEAAEQLANYGGRVYYGTTVWSNWAERDSSTKQNVLIEKYNSPTLAEMIWEEMQYDLNRSSLNDAADYFIQYLYCLIDLNDKRIAPVLVEDYKTKADNTIRRQYSYALQYLDHPEFWNEYVEELVNGEIPLPEIKYLTGSSISYGNPGRQPGNIELASIIRYLQHMPDRSGIPILQKLLDQSHPYYPWIDKRIIQLTGGYDNDYDEDDIYWKKEVCFDILQRNLDSTSNSDVTIRCNDGSGSFTTVLDWGGQSSMRMHERWYGSDFCSLEQDLELRARKCDMAAYKLYVLIFGIPVVHNHMEDKDQRIQLQKDFLNRFTRFRQISGGEYNTVNELYAGTRYVPDIKPLGRPATKEDVDNGEAIFFEDGNKAALDIELPAWGIHKDEKDKEHKMALKYLLMQAEYNAHGELIYGAFTEDGPQVIKASDLHNIQVYK